MVLMKNMTLSMLVNMIAKVGGIILFSLKKENTMASQPDASMMVFQYSPHQILMFMML